MVILPRYLFFVSAALVLSACAPLDVRGPSVKAAVTPPTESVNQCPELPPSNQCVLTNSASAGAGLWVFGDILAGDEIYTNGGIQIDKDGRIVEVGCITPPQGAAVLSCPRHVVSPGLINPHDHLKYNQNFPGGQNSTAESTNPYYQLCNNPESAYGDARCATYRYDRRNEWRKGLDGKPPITAPPGKDPRQVTWNELRHVMAGATTVAGSGGAIGLVRNPDVADLMEGLITRDDKLVDYNTFPLGDFNEVEGHDFGDCHYPNVVSPAVLDNLIFLPHVAEGINDYAQNELYCLTGSGNGSVPLQAPNSTFIHSVAANPGNANVIKQAGMSLVWSPRSNLSLYGNTAQVVMYDNMGIPVALSSDWTPSGSINMLREMSCAASYNTTYLNNHFSKRQLWKMATVNAAHALGIDDQVGLIRAGYWADLAIYNPIGKGYTSYYDPMIFSDDGDVTLVLRAGAPLYGDSDIIMALRSGCESVGSVCGSDKAVCLAETGYSFSALKAFNVNSYPLFFCAQPELEPSCTPARYGEYSGTPSQGDIDGDGIGNQVDNCPTIFNPIRPMDNHLQADYNGNGIGDACDPYPLTSSDKN